MNYHPCLNRLPINTPSSARILEYLRGICTVSLMQTTSLAAFPNLLENLPPHRYSVVRVVEAARSVLLLLEEMKLEQSLRAAADLRAMLQQMETFLAGQRNHAGTYLLDPFAERLIILSKNLALAVRQELAATSLHPQFVSATEGTEVTEK